MMKPEMQQPVKEKTDAVVAALVMTLAAWIAVMV